MNNISLKVCSKCKIEKNVEEFGVNKTGKNGLQPHCKLCHRKADYKYRTENKEKIKQKNRRYYYERGGKENDKILYIKNRERINKVKNLYHKKRYGVDFEYTMKKILRDRFRKALRGIYKSGSAVRDLRLFS